MPAPGRNDPCPCGSGKKFKKCCLGREGEPPLARQFQRAVQTALGWLKHWHDRGFELALSEAFGALDGELGEAHQRLHKDTLDTLILVATESLLTGAEIATPDGPRTAFELITGRGGPPLAVEEREVLEQLATRPLRLYEVASVEPGRGFELIDVVSGERSAVEERSGSKQTEPGEVLAARLLHRGDAVTLSGFALSFPRLDLQRLREGLRREEREVARLQPADARRQVDAWLIDAWVEMLVRRSRPPDLRAAGSGERVVLTTDHYRVRDWQALAAALAAEPEVEGSLERGGWTRLEHGSARVLLGLNVGRDDRLEAFAQTLGRADDGRQWLERVAGDLVTFRGRDVVDPREALQNPDREQRPPPPPVVLPPEAQQELIERIYARWADEPIPALGDKTPRHALRSRLGRERVIELLLSYEHEERKEARHQGRPPVDYGFLWRAVKLERPG